MNREYYTNILNCLNNELDKMNEVTELAQSFYEVINHYEELRNGS